MQQLIKQQDESRNEIIPQVAIHPRTNIYQHIMKHTKPFKSIMQYHRVYGALILNNIPLLKRGCNLELTHVQEIWSHANVAAPNTLVFMWCLGEPKTHVGVMEMLIGSPPFYIKIYILRCVKLLG